jgi:hypothetical protein
MLMVVTRIMIMLVMSYMYKARSPSNASADAMYA